MDLATFVARYLADASILGWVPLVRWDEQVRTWIDRARTSDRVLIVRYEDLHRDRRSVLEAISRFCRIPMSPQVIDLAVERSAFGAMRSEEEKRGAEAYLLLGGAAYREGPGRFYRRDGSMVGKMSYLRRRYTPSRRS